MKLTIAIPTYNRSEPLRAAVKILLPQLDEDCELRIYDNCSTVPMAEVLGDILKQAPHANVKVIRNRANIGMLGNILRCMEECQTPWLVMCGDDDPPDADFVEKARRSIAQYPEAIFISYALGAELRPPAFVTIGLSGFVQADYIFGSPLSISAGAYRMEALLPFMSTGYMYAYTLGPHIAILMAALRANHGQCAFVPERLAAGGEDFSLESWGRIWLTSLVILLELIPESKDREAFAKKIVCYVNNQTYMANFLMTNALKSGADNSFIFSTRMKLRSLLLSSVFISIKERIFYHLVKRPKLGLYIMKFLSQKKRQTSNFDGSTEDIFGRV